MKENIYVAKGYADRNDYLDSIALDYGISKLVVYGLAELLGPNEDFDGLIQALEEI